MASVHPRLGAPPTRAIEVLGWSLLGPTWRKRPKRDRRLVTDDPSLRSARSAAEACWIQSALSVTAELEGTRL
jgi:hypothetical protein